MNSEKPGQTSWGGAIFALLWLTLAVVHQFVHPLDTKFLALVAVGTAPWLLPKVAPFLTSFKVAGLEVKFRDLKAQVEQNKRMAQATAAQVMPGAKKPDPRAKAGAGRSHPVAHGIELPELEIRGITAPSSDTGGIELADADWSKGQFGG